MFPATNHPSLYAEPSSLDSIRALFRSFAWKFTVPPFTRPATLIDPPAAVVSWTVARSEERRVGKEGGMLRLVIELKVKAPALLSTSAPQSTTFPLVLFSVIVAAALVSFAVKLTAPV